VVGQPFYGIGTVIESSLLVQVVPFVRNYKTNPNEGYEIYSCTAASTQDISRATAWVFHNLSGKSYGHLQLLWFVWRWLWEKLFKKTPKGNWLPAGVVCSELNWHFLDQLGGKYAELVSDLDPNTTHCEDLYKRVKASPHLFLLIDEKELGQ
jgi:hypothetical protein